MTMAFIQITQRQGRVPVTIFQLLDRINLGNFAELEKISKGAYDSGTRDLVIDLSQIESLTSIGVRASTTTKAPGGSSFVFTAR